MVETNTNPIMPIIALRINGALIVLILLLMKPQGHSRLIGGVASAEGVRGELNGVL